MDTKNANEGLKRVIGIPALATTVVNNTIGAGIYALPAIVSLQMGASGIISYFVCAAILVTIMLCYMEIGSKITASGGSYIYVEKAFGPFAGFIVNWLFFFGWGVLGSAAVINIVADSMAILFPIFDGASAHTLLFVFHIPFTHTIPFVFHLSLARSSLFFVLLGAMVWINVRGAKESVKFLQYVTVIKILPLVGIVIFGFSHVKMANLHWQHQPAITTVGSTVLALFFAFAGFETSLNVSGEIKDPKRTVPRGIILGGGAVFIFYLLIQTVTQGVLGAQMSAFKDAPLAAVANEIVGPVGVTILLIAAIVSCLGNLSGDVLATPRMLFAGANDGLFPGYLAKVHPKFATPYLAVITYASLIFIFAISGEFKELAVLASGALLIIYFGVILAMLKLRRTEEPSAEKTFKVPGGYVIPVIAMAAILWLLANLSKDEAKSTAIFLAAICLIYVLMRWFRRKS